MRQLAAIMFADIEGYTAMMQQNEMQASRLREKFRKTLELQTIAYRGRIIQDTGDGALCTFNSAIDAVRAAIAIQEEMLNAPYVPLRIGIHSGDVMVEEKSIYGDGVNIASRIESFAVAGGVFISAKVYDEIKNQNDIDAVSLGVYELKNVKVPVEIYAISNAGLIVPSTETLQGKGRRVSDVSSSPAKNTRTIILASLTALVILVGGYVAYKNFFYDGNENIDKSIAVLPFENLSNDKEDQYFTEGMTDEILSELAQIPGLRVLSRTSTVQYAGTTKTMKEIGEELGVANLVEGSVRKAGDQLRVIVQLINAKTDNHIWAKTYNREVQDLFVIQSEIAQQIASELDSKLSAEDKKRIEQKPTESLEAYDYFLRGKSYANGFWSGEGIEGVSLAEQMFRSAFRIDPKFVDPYAYLVALYVDMYYYHMGPQSESFKLEAKGLLDTLLALKIDKGIVHVAIGSYRFKVDRDYNAAIQEFTKAIELDPAGIEAPLLRSKIYMAQGRLEEAMHDINTVLERNPNQEWHLFSKFEIFLGMRKPEEALMYIDKVIALMPDNAVNYKAKAHCLIALRGDLKEARRILTAAQSIVGEKFDVDLKFIDLLDGDPAGYLDHLLQHPDTIKENEFKFRVYASELGIIYRSIGKPADAKKCFAQAVDLLEAKKLDTDPNDFRLLSALGVAYAGIGNKAKAIEYGNRARQLAPLSSDIFIGIVPLENMALIYTLLGDQEEAIDILNQLMQLPFSWNTSNTTYLLRTFPQWSSLHTNPKFMKLIREGEAVN